MRAQPKLTEGNKRLDEINYLSKYHSTVFLKKLTTGKASVYSVFFLFIQSHNHYVMLLPLLAVFDRIDTE